MNPIDLDHLLLTALLAAEKAANKILEIYESDDFDIQLKSDQSPLTKADMAAHYIIAKTLKDTQIPILSEEGTIPSYTKRKNWKHLWIIDPLDGTKEFIKKNGEFTVNIALVENRIPILGVVYIPVTHTFYFGTKHIGSYLCKNLNLESISSLTQNATLLPFQKTDIYTVIASRSHLNQVTTDYLEQLEQEKGKIKMVSKGSSLKLCLIAEGSADEYPRFSPTMEWDIAAGHAVAMYTGAKITQIKNKQDITYNKENLLNPYFRILSKDALNKQ